MKIRVRNTDLSRELALLEKIVGQKPTIAVLGNVLIQTSLGSLVLSATDLEIGLVGACEAEVEEPGSLTLPAKKLMEIVRAQSDTMLTLASGPKGSTLFTSGQFSSRLQSLPASDFPGIPSIDGHPSIILPRAPLRDMLAQIRYAISDKGDRFFMNGAYMELKAGLLRLVATDGRRMSMVTTQRDGPDCEPALIPSLALDELTALLSESATTEVVFARSAKHLFFDLDGRLLISRTIDGKFPTYDRIIPKSNEHHMGIERLTTIAVLKRLVLINDIVTLHLKPGGLCMKSLNAEIGEGDETVVADYTGPEMVMQFNGQYLLDYLSCAPSPKVDMAVKDAATAAIFTDGDYVGVIMGMRV